ncbi:MAG: type II toxin-antitoxin system ParD family antitoxin [Blastopirellula sp.]|nr:MAG: type II toxin-antitoxin system ParD family antitoxin [Blastopirellula sp.]
MSTIPIDLPDDLRAFVESNVERGDFANVNEYIIALIHAARSNRSNLEGALLAGLDSGPAEEFTSQEWTGIKQRLMDRHQEG